MLKNEEGHWTWDDLFTENQVAWLCSMFLKESTFKSVKDADVEKEVDANDDDEEDDANDVDYEAIREALSRDTWNEITFWFLFHWCFWMIDLICRKLMTYFLLLISLWMPT